jgi:hypothetical protein
VDFPDQGPQPSRWYLRIIVLAIPSICASSIRPGDYLEAFDSRLDSSCEKGGAIPLLVQSKRFGRFRSRIQFRFTSSYCSNAGRAERALGPGYEFLCTIGRQLNIRRHSNNPGGRGRLKDGSLEGQRRRGDRGKPEVAGGTAHVAACRAEAAR